MQASQDHKGGIGRRRSSCAAEEGNVLLDFAIQALQAASVARTSASWRCTRSWLEFPEDLGRAPLGVPASIWQRSDLRALPGLVRRAFFQCEVAPVDYSKATGVLTDIEGFFDGFPSYAGGRSSTTIGSI